MPKATFDAQSCIVAMSQSAIASNMVTKILKRKALARLAVFLCALVSFHCDGPSLKDTSDQRSSMLEPEQDAANRADEQSGSQSSPSEHQNARVEEGETQDTKDWISVNGHYTNDVVAYQLMRQAENHQASIDEKIEAYEQILAQHPDARIDEQLLAQDAEDALFFLRCKKTRGGHDSAFAKSQEELAESIRKAIQAGSLEKLQDHASCNMSVGPLSAMFSRRIPLVDVANLLLSVANSFEWESASFGHKVIPPVAWVVPIKDGRIIVFQFYEFDKGWRWIAVYTNLK